MWRRMYSCQLWTVKRSSKVVLLFMGTAAAGNAATTGFGAGTATVVTTNTVIATATATVTSAFKLYVNNTSGATDTYDLATTSTIPTGYAVAFYNDGGAATCATSCSSLARTISTPLSNWLGTMSQ